MPEPEPVREPAPPPPRECRRRRRRRRLSGSSASSRACRAQRRLHLGRGGGPRRGGPGGGGGGAYPLAATESWACRVPRPRAEAGRWGRGARDSGRPHCILCKQQRRLGTNGGVAGATPPPARLGEEGARGRGPSALIGSQQGCPTHGLGRIPPRSASAGYCYNPGFPGATRMGRGSEHLTPPSTLEGNAQPLTLDPRRSQVLES